MEVGNSQTVIETQEGERAVATATIYTPSIFSFPFFFHRAGGKWPPRWSVETE